MQSFSTFSVVGHSLDYQERVYFYIPIRDNAKQNKWIHFINKKYMLN